MKKLGITDVVLRDAHQSLFATRMKLEDMLPIAPMLDKVGFWSLETWGGATFDACIRYLNECPWERLRALKQAMPNTPQQMLLRGQNILGYRNYADDVVSSFVERAAKNGIDVFRVFDAMNDPRNMMQALRSVKDNDKHAQGTISYTTSAVHNLDYWLDLAKRIEDIGIDSLCIKDMAGLLTPYTGFELVSRLKKELSVPIHMHCHATTGLSTGTIIKCAEAGIDNVDTAISSMSMTYGHSPTESIVTIMRETDRDTGLDVELIEKIASYFRDVRKKYAKYEGSLRGIDSRILVSQVPGGMLTNLESQLKAQKAENKFDEVLLEIPKVRKDLGYIPLVTPTSQIVGTQSVLNVLSKKRYSNITKEVEGIVRGEYGITPAPINTELSKIILHDNQEVITSRYADTLEAELENLSKTLKVLAKKEGFKLKNQLEDTLTYALFDNTALEFFKARDKNIKSEEDLVEQDTPCVYTVKIKGKAYQVEVAALGNITSIVDARAAQAPQVQAIASSTGKPITAPLGGTIRAVECSNGKNVHEGDVLFVLEAMKLETEIKADKSYVVLSVNVSAGDTVQAGDVLAQVEE